MLYLGYSLKDIQIWLGYSNYNFTYVRSGIGACEQMANTLSKKPQTALPAPLPRDHTEKVLEWC